MIAESVLEFEALAYSVGYAGCSKKLLDEVAKMSKWQKRAEWKVEGTAGEAATAKSRRAQSRSCSSMPAYSSTSRVVDFRCDSFRLFSYNLWSTA